MRIRLCLAAFTAVLCSITCQSLPTDTIPCAATGRCTPVSFVLGQPDPQSNINLHAGMNGPLDALTIGTKLFVADCKNNRILVWNFFPVNNQQPPDYVLGQPDFNTSLSNYGGVSARSMECPGSLAVGTDPQSNQQHFIVGDRTNGRILIWNGIPSASYQAADVVVGQSDFTGSSSSNRASATTITSPSVATTDDGKLVASDLLNNRVLIWNSIPQQDDQQADLVVGQPDMISDEANNPALSGMPQTTAAQLNGPSGNSSADSTSLYIPDSANARILIFNSFPTMNAQAGTMVLGQGSLTSITAPVPPASPPPPTATLLDTPMSLCRKNNQLWLADQGYSRVLMWNLPLPTMATNPPPAATLVLGQASLTAANRTVGPAALNRPSSVFSDGTHLVVPDTSNNRVMIWNLAGLKSGQNADLVLGQPDFTTNNVNNVNKIDGTTMNAPFALTGVGSRLIVSDEQNARLLMWTQLPQSGQDTPTGVWGQADMNHGQRNTSNITGGNLCTPAGLATDGTRLYATDPCNHRVLIWNTIPASPMQPADVVVGQAGMTTGSANYGGTTQNPGAKGLNGPLGVASDGQRLIVADTNNNRVLIWNSIPTQSGQAADLVLGQPDVTTATRQNLDKTSLYGPASVFFDGKTLIVTDTGADRVLIWNTFPTRNQTPADVVVGQTEFTIDQRLRPTDLHGMDGPYAAQLYQGRLYVVDRGNHRVLYFNTLPTSNGQIADGWIGQPTYSDYSANNAGNDAQPQVTAQTLSSPTGIYITTDMLYIADQGNNRILVVPNPPSS